MWLIKDTVARELRAAASKLVIRAEDRARFAAEMEQGQVAAAGREPASLRVAGDTAEIHVRGILVERPSFWLWLLGYAQTSYLDLQEAIAAVEKDDNVAKVIFRVDSPGGEVRGLFDTLAALEVMKKPRTVASALACSAAYAIAAVAGKVEAANAASEFGSVGVVATFYLYDDVVEITSTEAPDKRPDVSTEEGQAVVRKHLDDIHELFAGAIAQGRGTTVAKVNAEYGRGAVLLAGEAKQRGMIDSIAKPILRAVSGAKDSAAEPAQERQHMDLKTLKTQHSALCEELIAEGEAQGVSKERKRCAAHAKMARSTGANEVAFKAIESGASIMDDDIQAEYMTARMNRQDIQTRQRETDDAGAAADRAQTDDKPEEDLGDKVVAELEKQRGKKF